jgi:single-stranded-DNA-specific exonuclease
MKNTQLTYAAVDPEVARQLSQELGCHPVAAGLIWSRGFTTVDAARFFLYPDFSQLTDPFAIKDMHKAVERIYAAVVNGEKILIFGDFDADGVTATALIHEFLTLVDANVTWYIPHRIKEGYGITPAHIQMAAGQAVDLIITVDCGIGGTDAVAAAAAEDMEVIITDHHEPGPDLPKAAAVVDPKQADCPSGLSFLAGVGVAFFLVMALRKFFREKGIWERFPEPDLIRFLDLFAVGTIGDMVPLDRKTGCCAWPGSDRCKKMPGPGSRLWPGRPALTQKSWIPMTSLLRWYPESMRPAACPMPASVSPCLPAGLWPRRKKPLFCWKISMSGARPLNGKSSVTLKTGFHRTRPCSRSGC